MHTNVNANGYRNANSTRDSYMLASMVTGTHHAVSGVRENSQPTRPLQQTYSRYIDQENFNHMNMPNNVKNRVRFEQHPNQHGIKQHVISRNPACKSQNVSQQHTRTHTDINKESFSQEKVSKISAMASRPTSMKQDQNPTLGRRSLKDGDP